LSRLEALQIVSVGIQYFVSLLFIIWIVPEGKSQTFAEMEKSEKNTISHRFRALEKVKEFLDQ
jgi:hypothetical protein